MKKILSFIILLLFTNIFSGFNNPEPTPDVEKFALTFFEKLKSGDTSFYKNNFSLTEKDLTFIIDRIQNDPFTSEDEKTQLTRELIGDKFETLEDFVEDGTKNDKLIQRWIKDENIILNNIIYIKSFYNLVYSKEPNLHYMERTNVYLQYNGKIYEFQFLEVLFLNGKWVGGRLYRIAEVDQYLAHSFTGYNSNRYSYPDYDYATVVDSTMVYFDSTMAYDTVTSVSVPTVELTKKEKKAYKKINKYQRKIDKINQELYK